jgi:3-dehydroquinate synthase
MWVEISAKPLADQNWDTLIRHSVEFKARVTTQDPTEKGMRKILNAGHTIGHALESYLLNAGHRILHGEAIAVGLITEAFIARQRNLMRDEVFREIYDFILNIFGKVDIVEEDVPRIGELILQDKKNKDNRILCVLQNGIGSADWDQEISLDEVKKAFSFYLSIQR